MTTVRQESWSGDQGDPGRIIMKSATVYNRKSKYIIHAVSNTAAGVGIAARPFLVLEEDTSAADLGEAVMNALESARQGVPHPTDWPSVLRPLLDAAQVKSWSTFVRDTCSCEILDDGSSIKIYPTRNMGAQEGFQSIEAKPSLLLPSKSTAESIGSAVREALAISLAASPSTARRD